MGRASLLQATNGAGGKLVRRRRRADVPGSLGWRPAGDGGGGLWAAEGAPALSPRRRRLRGRHHGHGVEGRVGRRRRRRGGGSASPGEGGWGGRDGQPRGRRTFVIFSAAAAATPRRRGCPRPRERRRPPPERKVSVRADEGGRPARGTGASLTVPASRSCPRSPAAPLPPAGAQVSPPFAVPGGYSSRVSRRAAHDPSPPRLSGSRASGPAPEPFVPALHSRSPAPRCARRAQPPRPCPRVQPRSLPPLSRSPRSCAPAAPRPARPSPCARAAWRSTLRLPGPEPPGRPLACAAASSSPCRELPWSCGTAGADRVFLPTVRAAWSSPLSPYPGSEGASGGAGIWLRVG